MKLNPRVRVALSVFFVLLLSGSSISLLSRVGPVHADSGGQYPPNSPLSFSVSGASLYNTTTGPGDWGYSFAIPAHMASVTITANALGNPLCCNASYGGITSNLIIDFAGNPDTVFTQAGNGTSTTVTGTLPITDPGTTNVFGNVEFDTNCGSLRGCPDSWQSQLYHFDIYVIPKVSIHANATQVGIPGTVQVYGNTIPAFDLVNLTVYRDGQLFNTWYPSANVQGDYNYNFTFSTPDQAGDYSVVATTTNGDALAPGASQSVVSMFTDTATATFTVGASATTSTIATNSTTGTPGTLTGTITDPLKRPVQGATVQLLWSTTGGGLANLVQIGTTTTDQKGVYSFPVEYPMQGGGALQIILQNQYFMIEDNATFTSQGVPLLTAQFYYPVNGYLQIQSASDLRQDFRIVSTHSPSDRASEPLLAPYEDAGNLAVMYGNAWNAFSFYTTQLKVNFPLTVPVIFNPKSQASYFSSAAPIFIVINSKSLDDVVNREYHEIGHYVQYVTLGAGALDTPNDVDHAGFANPDSSNSWVEGWADFWGQVSYSYSHGGTTPATLDPKYSWAQSDGGSSVNFNNVWYVNGVTHDKQGSSIYDGNSEEFAIASILWSLVSAKDDLDGATTQLSPTAVFSILTGTYNYLPANSLSAPGVNRHVQTLTDIYYVLTNAATEKAYQLTTAQIDKIFKAHNVYQKNLDGTITVGIDNPSGGPLPSSPTRVGRQGVPFWAGSDIVVQSNPSNLPYTLTVQISYGDPYSVDDYSYSVNITQAAQAVNVYLPDSSIYSTTAVFTAGNGASQVTVATLNSTFYAANVGKQSALLTANPVTLQGGGLGGFTIPGLVSLYVVGAIAILLGVLAVRIRRRRSKGKRAASQRLRPPPRTRVRPIAN